MLQKNFDIYIGLPQNTTYEVAEAIYIYLLMLLEADSPTSRSIGLVSGKGSFLAADGLHFCCVSTL
jgi:hypothetical protein